MWPCSLTIAFVPGASWNPRPVSRSRPVPWWPARTHTRYLRRRPRRWPSTTRTFHCGKQVRQRGCQGSPRLGSVASFTGDSPFVIIVLFFTWLVWCLNWFDWLVLMGWVSLGGGGGGDYIRARRFQRSLENLPEGCSLSWLQQLHSTVLRPWIYRIKLATGSDYVSKLQIVSSILFHSSKVW